MFFSSRLLEDHDTNLMLQIKLCCVREKLKAQHHFSKKIPSAVSVDNAHLPMYLPTFAAPFASV